jgi:hypothetical protein
VDDSVPAGAAGADVAFVCAVPAESTGLKELVEQRRRDARPTIAVMNGPGSMQLAGVLDRAITTDATTLSILRADGIRAMRVPSLLTRDRIGELRAARDAHARTRASEPVIVGWHVGEPGGIEPEYLETVVEALQNVLNERTDAHIELVGDPARMPDLLLYHARVRVTPGEPDPATVAAWTFQCWTPAEPPFPADGVRSDPSIRPVVEAAYVGVSTVFAHLHAPAFDGIDLGQRVVRDVRDADEWGRRAHELLARGPVDTQRRRRGMARAESLYGPVTSAAAVNRLFGWVRYEASAR